MDTLSTKDFSQVTALSNDWSNLVDLYKGASSTDVAVKAIEGLEKMVVQVDDMVKAAGELKVNKHKSFATANAVLAAGDEFLRRNYAGATAEEAAAIRSQAASSQMAGYSNSAQSMSGYVDSESEAAKARQPGRAAAARMEGYGSNTTDMSGYTDSVQESAKSAAAQGQAAAAAAASQFGRTR